MSSSNCCFLTGIQISQEAGQVAWYAHLFQNFPQFVVIHSVKGFGIVNKAEMKLKKNKPIKLNIQKTKIMASIPITSWQIDGKAMEIVTDFILLDSKNTGDSDYSHGI